MKIEWMHRLLLTVIAAAGLAGPRGAAAAEPAPVAVAVESAAALALEVDVSARRLYVKKDGEVIRSFRVAVGRPGNPTPRGTFQIRRIIWNPKWVPPDADWAKDKRPREPGDPKNPMGRVKLFFREPDYYIHGTREVDSLGQAESRGCIRMSNPEVIELAKLVMEHGGAERSSGWFRRVVNRARSTQEVRLSRPVSLTIKS